MCAGDMYLHYKAFSKIWIKHIPQLPSTFCMWAQNQLSDYKHDITL